MEQVESELERISDARRRFGAADYDDLLARAAAARRGARGARGRPRPSRRGRGSSGGGRGDVRSSSQRTLRATREAAAEPFAAAVAEELRGVGMGDGEFRVELRERDPGPAGTDESVFLIRPNAGLPFGPVAETASGGELSRIALAIAAVGGGETLVFDEIDAGIGGETAHAVAATLKRLAERAQVITITHLPQIASVADTHYRVEKIPGDPTHTRIERLDDAQRRDELERMLGGKEFISTLMQMSSLVEHTGTARLGKRTKELVRRLNSDDIAIIDHTDLDRVSAEELVESGVRVVVNVAPSQSGRYPNPGPLLLVRGGVRLIDVTGGELFDEISDGERLTVRGGEPLPERHVRRDRPDARGARARRCARSSRRAA